MRPPRGARQARSALLVTVTVVLATLATSRPAAATIAPALATSAPRAAAALPVNRLNFGLANQPGEVGWMQSSGVPWRYRYVYLSGGVNTGAGWETYNTPAGQYAGYYMADSDSIGATSVFSYYEMCQSNGPLGGISSCGADNSAQDLANIDNAGVMSAYFANFRILLNQVKADGKPVVIHVEPDLWGYLQKQAASLGMTQASAVAAKVKTAGYSDAAVTGTADTAQGFACALLRMRDAYAPNAVMAIHASMWSSNQDLASNTSPTLNATTEADKTATFLNSACVASNPFGGTTWDLVFNDLDDHDAGWWESAGGCNCTNAFFTHWWDPTNVKFPNFNRYLSWVTELKARTAVPQVAWQVPVGNQYFLTMNNQCGHYQDNVAQYFLAHPTNLFSAGLIAVLFGSGNGCQSTNTDAQGDGITNNGGATTTDVAGFCISCNTHTSTLSDDDGGFLRIFVGQYYARLNAPVRAPVSQAAGSRVGRAPVEQVSPLPPPPNPRLTPTPRVVGRAAPAGHVAATGYDGPTGRASLVMLAAEGFVGRSAWLLTG